MNNIENTVQDICTSARAMGLSKRKEHFIENSLRKELRCSGPLFVVDRLKSLRELNQKRLVGEETTPSDTPWIKHDKSGLPKNWMSQLIFRSPKTSLRVIGSMIQAIQLNDPTENQIEAWRQNVVDSKPVDVAQAKKSEVYTPFGTRILTDFRKSLAHHIADENVFNLSDVTATAIPVASGNTVMVPTNYGNGHRPPSKDFISMVEGYTASINSAPPMAAQLELDNIRFVKQQFPDLKIKDEQQRLDLANKILSDNQDITDVWPEHGSHPNKTFLGNPGYPGNTRVGNISFMEKPGGKLRTVANPNRYLQKALDPLRQALTETFYIEPLVDVRHQEQGLFWAQEKLRKGETLDSFDLHAATDCLDADAFDKIAFSQVQDDSLEDINLQTFLLASQSLWYSPDLQSDVSWSCGQPLGLAPSFAYLTTMNMYAGMTAVHNYNGDHPGHEIDSEDAFRVVGDDFICDHRIGPYYNKAITGLGGVTNSEKMLTSDKLAEFCSSYITSSDIFKKKPTIRCGKSDFLVNLEKTSIHQAYQAFRKTPRSIIKMGNMLNAYSTEYSNKLPNNVSSNKLPVDDRFATSAYLEAYASLYDDSPELVPKSISVPVNHIKDLVPKDTESDKSNSVWAELSDSQGIQDILDNHQAFNPYVTIYDWRMDKRKKKQSSFRMYKLLLKKLKSISHHSEKDNGMYIMSGLKDPYDKRTSLIMLYDSQTNESALYLHNRKHGDFPLGNIQLSKPDSYMLEKAFAANRDQDHPDRIRYKSPLRHLQELRDDEYESPQRVVSDTFNHVHLDDSHLQDWYDEQRQKIHEQIQNLPSPSDDEDDHTGPDLDF